MLGGQFACITHTSSFVSRQMLPVFSIFKLSYVCKLMLCKVANRYNIHILFECCKFIESLCKYIRFTVAVRGFNYDT